MGLEAGEGEKGLGKAFFFVAASFSHFLFLHGATIPNDASKRWLQDARWMVLCRYANLSSRGVRQLARLHVNMLASAIPPDGIV